MSVSQERHGDVIQIIDRHYLGMIGVDKAEYEFENVKCSKSHIKIQGRQ